MSEVAFCAAIITCNLPGAEECPYVTLESSIVSRFKGGHVGGVIDRVCAHQEACAWAYQQGRKREKGEI